MQNPFYQTYRAAAIMAGADAVLPRRTADFPEFALDLARRRRRHMGAHVDSLPVLAVESGRTRDSGERDAARDRGRAPPRLSRGVRRMLRGALRRHAAAGRARRARCDRFLGSLARRTCWCCTRCPSARAPRGCARGLPSATGEILAALNRVRLNGTSCTPLPLLAAATALWSEDGHVEAMRARLRQRKDMADRLLGGFPGYYRPPCGFFLWIEVDDGVALTQRLWRDFALQGAAGRVSHPTRCATAPTRGTTSSGSRSSTTPIRPGKGSTRLARRAAAFRRRARAGRRPRAGASRQAAGSGLKLARHNIHFEPDFGPSQGRAT